MSKWGSKKETVAQIEMKLDLGKFDRKGYNLNKVYVRTTDSYNNKTGFTFLESGEGFFPGENITKNVLPPTLANAMFQLVADPEMPWQSVSQFVRDAVVHRIMYALDNADMLDQITNIQKADSLEKISTLKADALREGAEKYREAMKTAREILDIGMMKQVAEAFWADMVRTGDSHLPWVEERYDTFQRWVDEVEVFIVEKNMEAAQMEMLDFVGEQVVDNYPELDRL